MFVFFLTKLWLVLEHIALTCASVADQLKKEQTYSKMLVREAKHTRAAHAQQRLEEQQNKEQCHQKVTPSHSSAVIAAIDDRQLPYHMRASTETAAVKHQLVVNTESADWVSVQATKSKSVGVNNLLDAEASNSDSPRITTSVPAMTDISSQDPCKEPVMLKAPHTAPLISEQPATEIQQAQSADAAVNPVAASSVQHEPAFEQMADRSASIVHRDQVALVSNQHAQGALSTLSSTDLAVDDTGALTEDGGDASQRGKVNKVQETPADRRAAAAAKPPGAGDKIFDKAQEVVPVKREVSQPSTDPADVTAQHTQVSKVFRFKLACWCVDCLTVCMLRTS